MIYSKIRKIQYISIAWAKIWIKILFEVASDIMKFASKEKKKKNQHFAFEIQKEQS